MAVYTNGTCYTDADCNHGKCYGNSCYCNIYVLGQNCDTTFEESYGKAGFLAWQIVFTIIFFVTSSLIVWRGYCAYQEKKGWTLKVVGHLSVFLIAFLRFLYFVMDPMWQRNAIPLVLEQLLFGYAFVCDFTAFLIVLLCWAGAYHFSMKEKPKGFFFRKMKTIFWTIDIIWIIIEFVYRMFVGLNEEHLMGMDNFDLFDTVYNVYIAIICLGLSGGFAIYGFLLMRTLLKSGGVFRTGYFKKLTESIILLSVTFFITVILLVAVTAAGGLSTPIGAIASFSVGYILENILCWEMMYILRPTKDDATSAATSTTLNNSSSGISLTSTNSKLSIGASNSEL